MATILYQLNKRRYYEVYVQGRDPKGKRIQKKTKFDGNGKRISSERVANQVEFELKKELERLKKGICLWTWELWHNECLRRMKLTHKKSTIMGYDGDTKKWLSKEWNNREMTKFEKGHVHQLIFEDMPGELSASRKKTMLKHIRRIFELALEEGIIARNPAAGIKVKVPPSDPKVLPASEAEKLLMEAKFCRHRYYPLWAFALLTGMRNGEIYALRHSDINLEVGLIHVTKQFTSKDGIHPTKGNRNRVVPISDGLRPFLINLMGQGGHKETLWRWNDDKKKEITEVVWDDLLLPRFRDWRGGKQAEALRDFCRAAGITEVKFHDLRATFITNMLAQGVPITVVMSVVGHSQMSVTDGYNRLAGVTVKGSTDKLGYHLPEERYDGKNVLQLFGAS